MTTLYDVLGLGRQATAAQIEHGYKERLEALKRVEENGSAEDAITQLKVIREAYQVLSNPVRKDAYDSKLKAREQVRYEVVEDSHRTRNVLLGLLLVLMIGGGYAYKVQSENKARLAQLELEAAKEKAAAEESERLAAAEQAKLEQERLRKAQIDEAQQRYEVEQARREGQQVHQQLELAALRAERDKEAAERRAQADKQREDQLARTRASNEINAMRRALSIPIRRY